MDIKTIWVLKYDNFEVRTGEKIKIVFKNGDIISGMYNNSDMSSLSLICNKDINVDIDFKDIDSIEKIN